MNEEKERADRLAANCRWLVEQIDRIHYAICPGKVGTWQERAIQAAEAAEKLATNSSHEAN